ncbi:hypothetical protein BpHYR1_011214 [Brachionus plicatilis]|uniref:Uncharacterized protein n=1 Tax=Brachionus plicatilis TaxID=10195 RepID=A0A3M7SN58_BRAPC|nr:hypothetical protein BpHYR1_011214 [Brachionus plicatilis]
MTNIEIFQHINLNRSAFVGNDLFLLSLNYERYFERIKSEFSAQTGRNKICIRDRANQNI